MFTVAKLLAFFADNLVTSISSVRFATGITEPFILVRERDPTDPLICSPSCHENGFIPKLVICEVKEVIFESYLTSRSFKVAWMGEVSKAHILFTIYTTSEGHIIQAHSFSYHCYANNMQSYFYYIQTRNTTSNSTKQKGNLFSQPLQQHNFTTQQRFSTIMSTISARNLGVTFDD